MMSDPERVLQAMDLTSLGDSDTESTVDDLCRRALEDARGRVAAVCVWPEFVARATRYLDRTTVRVAGVANFPDGGNDTVAALKDIEVILESGGDEVDVVFPYTEFLYGDRKAVVDFLRYCRRACHGATVLKVILETGTLDDPLIIADASRLALDEGADFIKTSTGKAPVSATVSAARIMLQVIRETGHGGFKAAGGIRDVPTAMRYFAAADEIFGPDWAGPGHFRIGASGLLDDVLARLSGSAVSSTTDGY
ncbi:MAG: deoxyribose-phosphate aldolase [Alphaproteobacteria bacterium]